MASDTDLTPAYAALEKAHAEGDTKSAQKLADYIRGEQSKLDSGKTDPVGVVVADSVAETVSSWFKPQEAQEVAPQEVAGAVAGGAAAGAATGAVLPGALKVAGKFVPGWPGKAMQGVGEGLSKLPLKERMLRGAGGGAAMGLTEETGKAFGAPKAVTFGASMLAGGVGESAASFLGKETSQLLRFVGNLSYWNVAGAGRAVSGMLSPNKALNEATAAKLQAKLFGNPTGTYVNELVSSDNRIAAQEALRKADPSLQNGPWKRDGSGMAESDGEMLPMSGSREVGPAKPPPAALPEPAHRTGDFAAGKAGAAAKAQAQKDLEARAAEAAMKPASQIYRERMFDGVTAAVKSGKGFSTTPEFQSFVANLKTEVQLGNVSRGEADKLMKTLQADRLKSPAVQGKYAETVDDRIRQWGKPAEGMPAAGAAVVDAKVAEGVRSSLRQAYNQYTSKLGLGDIEAKYRGAYSQEMIAQAKDELPHFLYGFGSGKEFQKMARNLAKDPQGLPFIQQAMGKHLAEQAPKDIVREFERLQGVLVDSKLVQPKDLKGLREAAEIVKKTADSGPQLKRAQALKNMVLLAMTRQAGVAAGAGIGKQQAEAADQGE